MDPSDSIDVADVEDDAESLDELGMSVRTSDELGEDDAPVVVVESDDEDVDAEEGDDEDDDEDEDDDADVDD